MSVLNAFLAKVTTEIINPLMLLMAAVAFVVFLWGIFLFIKNGGEAGKQEEGRRAIMWGLIGMVIIFGVYGLLNIALTTFGLDSIQKTLQGG